MNHISLLPKSMRAFALATLTVAGPAIWGQSWGPTPASVRANVAHERAALQEASWTSGLELRSVGPSVMSGRVVDVAVVEDTLFVAYATGGLWKSINHGTTFEPLLDETCMLGAVAAHASGRVVVGSGEVNSSRSSYAGDGVYISDDHGVTWRHAGLEGSHHIGRVILDENNPDRMWVAALGELYSENRGGAIYRSENGGQTWQAVLTVPHGTNKNEFVGFVDMAADATDPNHLFAASWDRTRRAHNFQEGGPGTAVYETTDGGDTWQRISRGNGFPDGEHAGRVGLSYHSTSRTLYALVDNQGARPVSDGDVEADTILKADAFLDMEASTFESLSTDQLQAFLDAEGFNEADSAEAVKARVSRGELKPRALYDYLTDGNRALFDTEIVGAEVYRYRVPEKNDRTNAVVSPSSQNELNQTQHSQDGNLGVWERTHTDYLDDVCYTYGYYFGTVTVDPSNPETLYIAGVPLLKSTDGGATFESIGAPNVHADHHKVWVDPSNPNHLVNGNDGGINVSWDGGESWVKCNSPSVGQFYAVEVDEAQPYRIYGGLQDNGTWVGPHDHRESVAWHQSGHHGFESLGGGDGMQIEVDTRNNDVVYTGYQFGWYSRTERALGEEVGLHPSHELGETPLRWNWQTPILLSKHQQDVFYMGSNRVHRSLNRGDDFQSISHDLTRGGLPGNVPFGTLTTMDEHPQHFGQLAVGSDDGLVHVTLDGGHEWRQLPLPVPSKIGKGSAAKHLWVTEVVWSHHDPDLLVVALNGYRHDCQDAFVFATRDLGKSWDSWGGSLPHEPVNALVECQDRSGWWIVGTDGGAYLTVNEGDSFSAIHRELPRVPVHDLVVQERENELVIGTHGRGLYVLELDAILSREGDLETWSGTDLSFETDLLEVTRSERWGKRGWAWSQPREPVAEAWVWSSSDQTVEAVLEWVAAAPSEADSTSQKRDKPETSAIESSEIQLVRGWQQVDIPLTRGDGFLDVGQYKVTLADSKTEGATRLEATAILNVLPEDQAKR